MPIFNDNTPVKFIAGTPVTSSSPALEVGAIIYDTGSGALYIDTLSGRLQVTDPLKLSITGGQLTGNLEILDTGQTVATIGTDGTIQAQFLEATGVIHLDTAPHSYAVFADNDGERDSMIQSRTLSETITDLGIDEKIDSSDVESGVAVTSITAGDLPSFESNYDSEVLTIVFSAGTSPTATTGSDFLKNKSN